MDDKDSMVGISAAARRSLAPVLYGHLCAEATNDSRIGRATSNVVLAGASTASPPRAACGRG